MPDESTAPERAAEAPPPPPPPPPPPRRRHWRRWVLLVAVVVILIPALYFTVWTVVALHYTYSAGDRSGYVQKFSKKGWLCKSWEGQLAMVNFPGAMQEKWDFSVRSDSIADLITKSMGNRVSLHYDQHPRLPTSCFGETEYFITGVRVLTP